MKSSKTPLVFLALALLATTLAGCATSFTGSAHIEGGRATCEKKCAGQGLAMSGLVYMGEYSSACVCEVPGHSGGGSASASAGAAGAVGVMMQMRAQEQSSNQNGFAVNMH